MSRKLKIFLDSDVVISSLLSKTGAAYLLINHQDLKLFISNFSVRELNLVIKRLAIPSADFDKLIKNKLKIINLKDNADRLKEKYSRYVADPHDTHIVAGVAKTKAEFLISYNLKHYYEEKIKTDFGFIILTPAKLMQYLRNN